MSACYMILIIYWQYYRTDEIHLQQIPIQKILYFQHSTWVKILKRIICMGGIYKTLQAFRVHKKLQLGYKNPHMHRTPTRLIEPKFSFHEQIVNKTLQSGLSLIEKRAICTKPTILYIFKIKLRILFFTFNSIVLVIVVYQQINLQ